MLIRIQIVKYPPNSGVPKNYIKTRIFIKNFLLILYLSKKGKHFLDGGIYLVNPNFDKYFMENVVDEGDLSYGFGTIFHGVDVPKPIKNTENDEYMGRWWKRFIQLILIITKINILVNLYIDN